MESKLPRKNSSMRDAFDTRLYRLWVGSACLILTLTVSCSSETSPNLSNREDAGDLEKPAKDASKQKEAIATVDAAAPADTAEDSVPTSVSEADAAAAALDGSATAEMDASGNNADAGANDESAKSPDASRPVIGCANPGFTVLDISGFPSCNACQKARCVPSSLVTMAGSEKLGLCEDKKSKCVPDNYLATAGFFVLKRCSSLEGAEGRCVSSCIPEIREQKQRLPQDICDTDEKCAPCFDPLTGAETGSCRTSCDPGPTEPAVRFESCCKGRGSCVPDFVVEPKWRSSLGADTCAESDKVCIPNEFYDVHGFIPKTCAAAGGGEGRCLAECIPMVATQADRLVKSSCSEGSLCVPCFDPVTGVDTGACALSNDPGPTKPAYRFPECCGGLSMCIPGEIVPPDQQTLVGHDACAEPEQWCVPKAYVASEATPPAQCTSWKFAEGRCLPACLPQVAKDAERLDRDSCADGHLCVPCYDPITGQDSGACRLNGDPGPQSEPKRFTPCCGGRSVCVPEPAVVAKDRSRFAQGDCTEQGYLCVPTGMAQDPNGFIPPSCTSWNGAEGRCHPACLPEVVAQAPRIAQESCESGYLCVPCFDQITGEDTEACRAGADRPRARVVLFDKCCSRLASCVPERAVQPKDRPNLGKDSCTNEGELCLPDQMGLDPRGFVPPTCHSWGGGEGRCLPSCLPQLAANRQNLTQDSCIDGYVCSPCSDPLSGTATSACSVAGDTGPKESLYRFPSCCNSGGRERGMCLPRVLAGAQASTLQVDTCPSGQSADFVCAPDEKILDPNYRFPSCTTGALFGNGPGACLPDCMVSNVETLLLGQRTCQTGEVCAPCERNGEVTGACQ
jgi:hypothetical protein